MVLAKKIKDKKVNIEFNKEFIKIIEEKIKLSDSQFIDNSLKELHPSDSADIIENLSIENRSKLIELEGFNIESEIFLTRRRISISNRRTLTLSSELWALKRVFCPQTMGPPEPANLLMGLISVV